MHFLVISLDPLVHISQMRYCWNPWIILNFIKILQKAFQVTQIVWFPQDLTLQTKPHKSYHVYFLILLPFGCSSQSNSAPTRQTGSEAISLRCIDVSMPNLLDGLMTPRYILLISSAWQLDIWVSSRVLYLTLIILKNMSYRWRKAGGWTVRQVDTLMPWLIHFT